MLTESQVKSMLKQVMWECAPLLAGRKVFLFGSRVRGQARLRSDFDVGIIGEEPMSLKDFYLIEDRLEALPTLFKIDWVDFNRVSPVFRERAMGNIEVLYE